MAGYISASINFFATKYNPDSIILVHYPINSEAPFTFNFHHSVKLITYSKENETELRKKLNQFSPQVILCSGWSNSFYLNFIRKYNSPIKKVVCFDTIWKGTLKNYIMRWIGRFYIKATFNCAWVCGDKQKLYAQYMGFASDSIYTGFYTADSNIFDEVGRQKLINKNKPFPKTIFCVARYIPQKNLPLLWDALIHSIEKSNGNWQLICSGTGIDFNSRTIHPKITHLGFKQPDELANLMKECGVFVLPSIFEPWGVAVHEAAYTAMPLILSNTVGASEKFVTTKNGWQFNANDKVQLQNIFDTLFNLSDNELWAMAEQSYLIAQTINLNTWATTLKKIIDN